MSSRNNFNINCDRWYVKRNNLAAKDCVLGPFSYFEIVRHLQEKLLFPSDFIRTEKQTGWIHISECDDFKPDQIRNLFLNPSTEIQNLFFKRAPRTEYNSDVLIHSHKIAHFKGQSMEISTTGVGIILPRPDLNIGQSIFLYFLSHEELPKFNAIGEVVNQRWMQNQLNQKLNFSKQNVDQVKYGIRFLNVNKEIKELLKEFTHKEKKNKAA